MKDDACYIIIVVYNSINYTIKCIDSILNSKNSKYKIILIDNGSDSKIKHTLKAHLISLNLNKTIKLLELNDNYGYGYGVNYGIKYSLNFADCSYLWVLNNDVKIGADCLSNLRRAYSKNSIISPAIYDYDDNSKVLSLGGLLNPFSLTTKNITKFNCIFFDFLTGASLFFDPEVIKKNGYFSTKYFMYYEDVDWSIRARKNNLKLELIENCKVFHKDNKRISYKLKTISQLNRIRLSYDHYLYKLPLVFLIVLISLIITPFKLFFNTND